MSYYSYINIKYKMMSKIFKICETVINTTTKDKKIGKVIWYCVLYRILDEQSVKR